MIFCEFPPINEMFLHSVFNSAGGKVELWDIESGATSSSVRAHDDGVTGLQVSPLTSLYPY